MKKEKNLQLRCCKKDFEELVNWKQTERYLEVKKYWESRLLEKHWNFKSFEKISIKNWYNANSPEIIFKFNKDIWIIKRDWKDYFKIKLWDILEIKNYEK